MMKNIKVEADGSVESKPFQPRMVKMDHEGFLVLERMKEIMGMCERMNPLYENISNFSVAFYVLGFFDSPDCMSFEDLSEDQAVDILNSEFSEINFDEIPEDYHIAKSKERYLLVIGDPLFPLHFAVVSDKCNSRPYFSKLPFLGAGYDSLDELFREFNGIDGLTANDFHFFQKKQLGKIPSLSMGKIYIVKD